MHSAVISTHQQRHTSKTYLIRRSTRCACGNRQRINFVHEAVPRILVLKGLCDQDVCEITFFRSPWPIYTSVSALLSSYGGRNSGQIMCLSSSIRRRPSQNANASGIAQPIEELCEEYFEDPSRWWDNRADKRNPTSPDFKHKVTRKTLRGDGWSTPAWVRTRLKSMTQGKLHSYAVSCTNDSYDIEQPSRLSIAGTCSRC